MRLGRSKPHRPIFGRKVPAAPVATAYTFTGPSSGTVNVASTNFTVTPNGTSTATVTPTSDGAGSFTPATVTFDGTATAKTFTYTPTSTSGSPHTLSVTDDGGLGDPASIDYTVNSISGTIAVATPADYHGYRTVGGTASIAISGTYTGGPGTLTVEASFNGGAYATIATAAGGTFSGTLTGQAAGQGTLTVRFVNATNISDTVAYVSIGVVIAIAGQSNASGVLNNLQSYSHATLKAVCYKAGNSSYTAPGVWADGNDPLLVGVTTGSPWPLLATHLMEDLGVPVIFIETAIGGRTLVASNWYWTKFRPDTGDSGGPGGGTSPLVGYGEIDYSIETAATGGVDAMIWYQGESDVDAGSIERHTYAQAIGTFADQIASDVSNSPPLAVVQFGHDGSETPVDPEWADAIKLALSDFTRSGGNVLNGMVVVSDFSTSLHILTDAEGQKVADRMYALLRSEVYGGTAGAGRGPRVVACQHNATRTELTVCFDKVLKTGLVFDTDLWTVTGNGSGATVTDVDYHATDTRALVVTLSGAAALPILVSFAQGGDTAGLVWPLGPDFMLPAGAGAINMPAEPFSGTQAAAAADGGTSGGGLLTGSGMTGGFQRS